MIYLQRALQKRWLKTSVKCENKIQTVLLTFTFLPKSGSFLTVNFQNIIRSCSCSVRTHCVHENVLSNLNKEPVLLCMNAIPVLSPTKFWLLHKICKQNFTAYEKEERQCILKQTLTPACMSLHRSIVQHLDSSLGSTRETACIYLTGWARRFVLVSSTFH